VSATPYDRLGRGYSRVRRPDPRIAARIDAALGQARTVLNVGAGTGSYEPPGRDVTAVDPSAELPAGATVEPIPVPRDCTDLFFAALWARPEKLFDEEALRPMWVWQSIPEEARQSGRERLRADLESGAWEQRYGHLRTLPTLDVGLRLVSVQCSDRESKA
jgi:hypothetical protein